MCSSIASTLNLIKDRNSHVHSVVYSVVSVGRVSVVVSNLHEIPVVKFSAIKLDDTGRFTGNPETFDTLLTALLWLGIPME